MNRPFWTKPSFTLPLSVVLGLFAGFLGNPLTFFILTKISEVFLNLLKMVSLPIIFLSVLSVASSMGSVQEIRKLGKRVVKYTLMTTMMAATVALLLFLIIDPVGDHPLGGRENTHAISSPASYADYLLSIIPSNIVKPFVDNNVMSVMFLAMLLSFAVLELPEKNRSLLHGLFSSLFQAIMKITSWIVLFIPIAIFAFVALFVRDFSSGVELEHIALYLFCVVLANLIQAFVVLPTLLLVKGINPLFLCKSMFEALSCAFFTKSSNATLPMAVKCAEERAGISRKVAGFSFPLCVTINMNGCAAFILTTVLFVSMSHGVSYTLSEMVLWIFIATIAAVGNAGVPMGCYFLSSALLAAMNVPLPILGIILPFYGFIDMLETAINVWSDSCVTAIVDKEERELQANA